MLSVEPTQQTTLLNSEVSKKISKKDRWEISHNTRMLFGDIKIERDEGDRNMRLYGTFILLFGVVSAHKNTAAIIQKRNTAVF